MCAAPLFPHFTSHSCCSRMCFFFLAGFCELTKRSASCLMTRAPSVSFSPVEGLCSCVSVSFLLLLPPVSVLSQQQQHLHLPCSLQPDLCQPQPIKPDTSSNTEPGSLNNFPRNLLCCFFCVYSQLYNMRALCHMFWLFPSPYGSVCQIISPAILQKLFSVATNQLSE